jgi:uncharacterized membrane protein YvbJ
MNHKEETKEDFCGACVAGVAALAGVGTASVNNRTNTNRGMKRKIFIISMIITFISIVILIYLLCFKNCTKCA